MDIDITLAEYEERLRRAQEWLGNRVLEDCKPHMPYRTGALQNNSYTEDGGRRVVFDRPYAAELYNGVRPNGEPIHFSSPNASPRWFEVAESINREAWINGVNEIVGGE